MAAGKNAIHSFSFLWKYPWKRKPVEIEVSNPTFTWYASVNGFYSWEKLFGSDPMMSTTP